DRPSTGSLLLVACSRYEPALEWDRKQSSEIQNLRHQIVVVLHRRTKPAYVTLRHVQPETGLGFAGNVTMAIRGCSNLDVDLTWAARWQVVFDSRVGNDDLVVHDGKIELLSNLGFDLAQITVWLRLARKIGSALYLGLQLEIESHARVSPAF